MQEKKNSFFVRALLRTRRHDKNPRNATAQTSHSHTRSTGETWFQHYTSGQRKLCHVSTQALNGFRIICGETSLHKKRPPTISQRVLLPSTLRKTRVIQPRSANRGLGKTRQTHPCHSTATADKSLPVLEITRCLERAIIKEFCGVVQHF